MSKILKRPMFRKGGKVEEGVMSLAAPRKQYEDGGLTMEELLQKYPETAPEYQKFLDFYTAAGGRDYEQEKSDILSNLLIRGGLGLVSGEGAGKGTLGSIATAFRGPTEQAMQEYSAIKKAPSALKTAALGSAITAEEARKERELELEKAKIPKAYESGSRASRIEAKLGAAKLQPGFDEATEYIRISREVDLEDAGLFGNYRGSMVDNQGNKIPDEVIETNEGVAEGSIFYDPVAKVMKQKKKNPAGDFDLVPISSRGE
jgi:hypothetical protein